MEDFLSQYSYIIAQCFGFIAMGLAILSYQFKKHKTILILLTFASLSWCFHFVFLGLMTPVLMNVINVIRGIVYSFRDKKWANNNIIPVIFIIMCGLCVIFTWENYLSLLPFIASIFATIANWQKDTKKLKILTIPVCAGWFIYNTINHSIAGMLNEALALGSIAVYFIRYFREKNKLA